MKTPDEIRREIIWREDDKRVHYEPANVEINAPLALIQVDLVARINALRWVLQLAPFQRGRKLKYRSETGKIAARARNRKDVCP